MNLRCKVGDIAIIVHSHIIEHIGRTVLVKKWLGTLEGKKETDYWVVEADWIPHHSREGWMVDHGLLPISPPAKWKETEKDKELEKVE